MVVVGVVSKERYSYQLTYVTLRMINLLALMMTKLLLLMKFDEHQECSLLPHPIALN